MRYLPHTPEDIRLMLEQTGCSSLPDLFSEIPSSCRPIGSISLGKPVDEWELTRQTEALAATNTSGFGRVFVGAGSYSHHTPAFIPQLLARSEFYTAYTPYQPEISQGTLQAIFEYQTLSARLLGMDVANASMYDGASALAEALLMAIRVSKGKKTVAISQAIHPHYREVVRSYFQPTEFSIVELDFCRQSGRTLLDSLPMPDDLAAVALQSPNFFGCVEELEKTAALCHKNNSLLVACFSEPLAFGLLTPPGSLGADIACGEGQSLGLPQSFGGPGLGIFACRKAYIRNLPGRVVGQTKDNKGERGFVLTLSTREQHIRREKATSNICSNQGLCATAAGMYMASLGSTGLVELARLNYNKAAYLRKRLVEIGFISVFTSPVFNEFTLRSPGWFSPAIHARLKEQGTLAGLHLERYYPQLKGCYLFCATETALKEDIDRLVDDIIDAKNALV